MSHVALLHYAGPPGIGGVEATIAAHARALADAGHTVTILAGSGSSPDPRVTTVAQPLLGSRGPLLDPLARELAAGHVPPAFRQVTEQLTAWLADALAGVEVLLAHNVLTLHKNLALTNALWQLHSAARLPRLVAWCHDFAWQDQLYLPELHAGEPWELLRRAWPNTRYVAVSQDRRAALARLLGVDPTAIAVIPPGVDPATLLGLSVAAQELVRRFDLLAADPLLILPARVTRRKNIELAIGAVGALLRQGHPARLVVTGPPGPHNPTNAAYLAQLQALRAELGAQDAVIFLHETYTDAVRQPLAVSDDLVAQLLRLADGLLFPSRAEGFGMPILEAGLIGLPIFCTDLPPLQASAEDAAVYFAPDARPEAVAALITATLDADPRARLRRRVRQAATWQAIYTAQIAPLLADGH